jgi:RNA polymerase primary sigma factor
MNKINSAYSVLEQTHERPPSQEEIANKLDMSLSQVKNTMKSSGKHLSMDAPLREGEGRASSLYDVIGSEKLPNPDQGVMKESLLTDIDKVLKTLPERESDIIRLYFGIGDQAPKSLVEIGETFDLTRERVRQIKKKAILRLRNKSRKEVLMTYL